MREHQSKAMSSKDASAASPTGALSVRPAGNSAPQNLLWRSLALGGAGGCAACRVQRKATAGGRSDPLEQEAELAGRRAVSAQGRDHGVCQDCGVQAQVQESRGAPIEARPSEVARPSGGQPLPPDLRDRIESVVQADLAAVRVHADDRAQESARAINARAFTSGSDIILGPHESIRDVALMAHEAAHTVQQSRLAGAPGVQRLEGVTSTTSCPEFKANGVTANANKDGVEVYTVNGYPSNSRPNGVKGEYPAGTVMQFGTGDEFQLGGELKAKLKDEVIPLYLVCLVRGDYRRELFWIKGEDVDLPAVTLPEDTLTADPEAKDSAADAAPGLQNLSPDPLGIQGKVLARWGETMTPSADITARVMLVSDAIYTSFEEAAGPASVLTTGFHGGSSTEDIYGIDGSAIIEHDGKFYVYLVAVDTVYEDFNRHNVETGLDTLNPTGAVPGVRAFVTIDGHIAPMTNPNAGTPEPTYIVERERAGKNWHSTEFPTEASLKPLVEVAKQGANKQILRQFDLPLFKALLKAKALAKLRENKQAVRDEVDKYKTAESANAAWQRLREIMDADKEAAARQEKIEHSIWISRRYIDALESDYVDHTGAIEDAKKDLATKQPLLAEVKKARATLRREYPAIAMFDPSDFEIYDDNEAVYKDLKAGAKDLEAAIDHVITRVHEDDIPVTKLGPIVQQVLKEMDVTPEKREQGDPLSTTILGWLDDEDRTEAIITWVGTIFSISLAIGAFFATGGLALFLGVAGAALGLGTAAYELERADDLYAAAEAGTVGEQLVSDPEQAKFNYVMGWINLVLAGVDLALSAKAASTLLKGGAAAESLGARAGGEVLARLSPADIVDFDRALALRQAGKVEEAEALLNKLRTRLGDESFDTASEFFERTARAASGERTAASVAEDVLEERAVFKGAAVEEGHELMMDASGAIFRCSDTCTNLWLQYGDVLGRPEHAHLRGRLKDIERRGLMAKASGSKLEADKALKEAQDLEAQLKYLRDNEVVKLPNPAELHAEKSFAHDVGVASGNAFAKRELKLVDVSFDNPIKQGAFGQGFDDIMAEGADLQRDIIYIVEYKGGSAGLSPGQMDLAWMLKNIGRLANEGGVEGKKWADILMKAFREGRLKGIALSTPISAGAARQTKVIGRWIYTP